MPVTPSKFNEQVKILTDAFALNFDDSAPLTPKQKELQIGASEAFKNGRFCKSKSQWGEALHPFQIMVNSLLDKGVISTNDTMKSLGKCLIENKDKLDQTTVNIIFNAAFRSGLLKPNSDEFRVVLESARLQFNEVVKDNKARAAATRKVIEKNSQLTSPVDSAPSPGLSASSRQESPVSPMSDESLGAALRRVSEIKDLKTYQTEMKAVLNKMKGGHYPGTVQHDRKEAPSPDVQDNSKLFKR